MILPGLLLSLALAASPGRAAIPPQPGAAFDSTRHLIELMGEAVGDVKTGLDLFQRAAYNAPPSGVAASAFYLLRACRTLDLEARLVERRICRRCAEAPLQQALEGYRAVMPTLRRMGSHCANRLASLSRGSDTTAAENLRRNVRVIGGEIVAGIWPYEQRLAVVRVRAGWAPQSPPPSGTAPRRRERPDFAPAASR